MNKLICLATLALISNGKLEALAYEWITNAGGSYNWETDANWTSMPAGTHPSVAGDVATFGQYMGGLTGNIIVTDTGGGPPMRETVGQIIFQPNSTGFTYQLAAGQSDYGVNMVESGMSNPKIQVQTGAQTSVLSNAGYGILAGTFLDIDVASGHTFIINSGFDNTAGMQTTAGINIIGGGTVSYSGNGDGNIYTGTTTVSAGTLQLNKSPNSAGFAFQGPMLISGGTVQHMASNQNITGTSWTIDSGTWNLGAFTEDITSLTFNGGTFTGPGSTLTLSSAATALEMRDTTIDTNLILTGGAATIVEFDASNNGTATLAGTIDLGASNKDFLIGSGTADIDMSISSIISNGSVTKTGAGTLQMAGANTYTGSTDVTAGTLLIGPTGSLADHMVTVSLGAVLGGTGTIGTAGAVVTNSGTVAPGLSPGVLTINGNYTQMPGGTLSMELLSPTSFDQLVVNGGGVMLDGTLDLYLLPDHTFSGTETLILVDNTTGTGLTGTTFSTINRFGFPAAATTEVSYTANTVLLTLFVPAIPDAPANSTAFTAPVLSQSYQNIINFSRRLSRLRFQMQRGRGATSFATQESFSDSFIAAAESPSVNGPDADLATGDAGSSNPMGKSPNMIAQTADSPTTRIQFDADRRNTWGVFADGVGSVGRVYKKSDQDPYRYYSAGGFVGADYVGDFFGIGLSPGYEYLQGKTLNHQSKFDIQSAGGTIFATVMPLDNSNFFIDLIGGGAAQWYNFHRNTVDGDVHGKPSGYQWNVYGDIGYTATSCNWSFTPFLGLGYVQVHVPSYHETGPSLQTFDIGKQNISSLRSSLGATGSYVVEGKYVTFIPEANVLWQREFLNNNQNVSFASAPLAIASQMQVVGLGRNNFFAGGMLRFLFDYEIEVDASYDYEWNNRFHSHLFYLGLEKRF